MLFYRYSVYLLYSSSIRRDAILGWSKPYSHALKRSLHSCHERTFFIHFTGIVTVLNRNPFFPFFALQASRLKLVTRHIPFFNHISSSPSNPPILSCLARSLKLRKPLQISHLKSLLYSLRKH